MKALEDMKNEGDVKEAIKEILDRLGAWYYMHVPVGYGRTGIPDFTVVLNGRGVGIEAKFANRPMTGRQQEELDALVDAGGVGIVVNQWGLEDMVALLYTVYKGAPSPAAVQYFLYKKPGLRT